MQHLNMNSDFNKLKVNNWTHVKMLIFQEMWKFSLNHSSIIVKYWVACVLVCYNKCNMQFVSNDFYILKMNGSIMIIEKLWKKLPIHSNINVGFKIIKCVLINYAKCKMQLLGNGFMLKVDGSTHVPWS